MPDKHEIFRCNCSSQCGMLVIDLYDDKDMPDMYITYYINGAYPNIKSKWQLIWKLLRGVQYPVYEVAINQEQWKKFIESEHKRLTDEWAYLKKS